MGNDFKQEIPDEGLKLAKEQLKRFKNDKIDFQVRIGTKTMIFTYFDEDTGKRCIDTYTHKIKNKKYLGFLKRIKTEVSSNRDKVKNIKDYSVPSEQSDYFSFSSKINEYAKSIGKKYVIADAFEIDITAAYYLAAKNLGYISKELYEEMTDESVVPKEERLWLLGAIATKYVIETYEKGELIDSDPVKDDLLRDAWKNICNYIDYIMMDMKKALGGDFLFYWVDGIYFKSDKNVSEKVNMLKGVALRHKAPIKVTQLMRIEVENTAQGIKLTKYELDISKPKGFKEKQFTMATNHIKEYKGKIFEEIQLKYMK